MKKQYYIEPIIKTSFNKYLDNFGAFIATSASSIGLYIVCLFVAIFAIQTSQNFLMAIISLIIGILMVFLGVFALSCQSLELTQGKKPTFNTFNNYTDCLGNYILAMFISGFLSFVGICLCYVPGLIIMSRLCLTTYYVLDKKMAAIDAIKSSWKATDGHTWNLLGANLLLGMIAGLLGIFSMPMQNIGLAYIYQELKEDELEYNTNQE